MAGDCGLNALSLLPENMLPQWQQKIALRAENPSGHTAYNDMVEANFLRSNFLQVLDLHIFLQKQPGHWGRGCLHFHLLLYPIFVCQMAMDTTQEICEEILGGNCSVEDM